MPDWMTLVAVAHSVPAKQSRNFEMRQPKKYREPDSRQARMSDVLRPNRLLGTDTQQQNAGSRRLLLAGQRQR